MESEISAQTPIPPEKALAGAYQALGREMFQELTGRDGNIVMSPYSIGSAITMVFAGARGDTASEMAKVLGLSLPIAELSVASAALIEALTKRNSNSNSFKLHVANALAVTRNELIDPNYEVLLKTYFSAEILHWDLGAINHWVAFRTEGNIDHILDELPRGENALLINAIYLKARWAHPFDQKNTIDDTFHLSFSKKVKVATMRGENSYAVVEEPDYKAIRLPFRGDPNLAMIVVAPDAVDGLGALSTRFGADELARLRGALRAARPTTVKLKLPRFRAGFKVSLKSSLQHAGLELAFDPDKSDFSGMTGQPPANLHTSIDDVIHSAVIEVSELGAEAAAVAVAVMNFRNAWAPNFSPKPFVVDRPFLFFIIDDASEAILFQGRILDPR